MSSVTEQVRLVEREVGRQWMITSPDVPGLYVAHADLDVARRAVPGAIQMLQEMQERAASKQDRAVKL